MRKMVLQAGFWGCFLGLTLFLYAQTGADVQASAEESPRSFHQILKEKFLEGGPEFMGITLLTLIFGLAIAIERIITLTFAAGNTRKLLQEIEEALSRGDVETAREVCKKAPGVVPKILYQALERVHEGLHIVENTLHAYGSVFISRLEKNLPWISLFIAIAPMLGFMGTVIGMIQAFDEIEKAGDISPSIVAGGIKVALLTTLLGLIIAIILQVFYNYILSRIDELVSSMEDASTSLLDMLIRYRIVRTSSSGGGGEGSLEVNSPVHE